MKPFKIEQQSHVVPQYTRICLSWIKDDGTIDHSRETVLVKAAGIWRESDRTMCLSLQLETDYIDEHKRFEQEILDAVCRAVETGEIQIPCHLSFDQRQPGPYVEWFEFSDPVSLILKNEDHPLEKPSFVLSKPNVESMNTFSEKSNSAEGVLSFKKVNADGGFTPSRLRGGDLPLGPKGYVELEFVHQGRHYRFKLSFTRPWQNKDAGIQAPVLNLNQARGLKHNEDFARLEEAITSGFTREMDVTCTYQEVSGEPEVKAEKASPANSRQPQTDNRKMKKNNTLSEKAALLARVVVATSTIYKDERLSKAQRNMLQTIIGAGIFYISSNEDLYSGKISKAAREALRNNPDVNLVKEHAYPRKIAGQHLFERHVDRLVADLSALEGLFKSEMGKYNLVLKAENDRLRKHQRTENFLGEEEAYRQAGIEMVALSPEEYRALKKNGRKNKPN